MIQSKYKYNHEMAVQVGKRAYKLKKGKKDKIVFFLIPFAMLIMVGVLLYDIFKKNNIVLDIVLLSLLIFIGLLEIFMPLIITKTQEKGFKKLEEIKYDFFLTEYDKGVFKEKVYKESKLIMANEVTIDKLQNYELFDHYLLLIFSNYAIILFDLDNVVSGNKDDLLKIISTHTIKTKK